MNDIRDELIKLGENLANEKNEAFNLWTMLPSYKAAQLYHDDYAIEFMPSIKDILIEATIFIRHECNPNETQIKSAIDYYCCPCDDAVDHPPVINPRNNTEN